MEFNLQIAYLCYHDIDPNPSVFMPLMIERFKFVSLTSASSPFARHFSMP